MTKDNAVDRTVIIAELCQNHLGDRSLLSDLVHSAAAAGADYVKIQGLYSGDLVPRDRFEEKPAGGRAVSTLTRPISAERARLARLDLSPDVEYQFVDECRSAGVQPLITVFTRASIPRLAAMGFPAVKIASADCASLPMLRGVAEHWDRIFLSTGAAFLSEVERAVDLLAGKQLSLLHCVMEYPTRWDHARLARMDSLRKLSESVGLSDHSAPGVDDLWISKLALAMGAQVIERHFTVLGAADTKDGPVSVNPEQLRELRQFASLPAAEQLADVKNNRPDWGQALECASIDPTAEELVNRDYYAGRVASWVGGRHVYNWEDLDLAVVGRFPELVKLEV